jgi:hypothetical protein
VADAVAQQALAVPEPASAGSAAVDVVVDKDKMLAGMMKTAVSMT